MPILSVMKNKYIIIAVIAALTLAIFIPLIVFFIRSPILIVTEQSFILLYGQERLRREINRSSLALFRPVKVVAAANDAGADIVQFAVAEVSSKPFCVFFPRRFSYSAELYRGQNPGIRTAILEGRYPASFSSDVSGSYNYSSDVESDFFRAGYAAAVMSENRSGSIAVFMDSALYSYYGAAAREAFERGMNERETSQNAQPLFYTSFSDRSVSSELSAVVIAGAGWEYLDSKTGVPVILFSWLDPDNMPEDVVIVIDDSPAAQLLQAAFFVKSEEEKGKIKSFFHIIRKDRYNGLLRNINKM